MSLARNILQQNTDPTFVNNLIENPSIKKNNELLELLKQGRDTWFSDALLQYMFDEYESVIKDAIKISYHPVIIRNIREYTLSQWYDHRNIANHIFPDRDYFFDFFATYREIKLDMEIKSGLVEKWFSEWSMLLGSSFVYGNSDNLHILFSKIKKNLPKDGEVTINYIHKWFTRVQRQWLDGVSSYLSERFSDKNLFDILNLDPEKIL